MNTLALKAEIVKNGLTVEKLGNKIGISKSAINRKITGKTEFKLGEIKKIISILKLNRETTDEIFFKEKVS